MFKGHCFPKAIILQAVYFKLRFSLSDRDLEHILLNNFLSFRGYSTTFVETEP